MKRRQLFEFNDLTWFPETFRRMITDGLTWGIETFKLYDVARPQIERLISKGGSTQVIDLCSGAGGPWPSLLKYLSARGLHISVTLTDLHPNQEAVQAATKSGLHYYPTSVDALKIPVELRGTRSIFTGFHHFPPKEARLILEDAARQSAAIGVFEFTERSAGSLLILLLTPLAMPLFSFFIKPFSLTRIFWSVIVPVVPIAVLWDGIVSGLRTYTPEELLLLASDLPEHHWEAGQAISTGVKITYLIGWPKERE
jgi:hypothetical protein